MFGVLFSLSLSHTLSVFPNHKQVVHIPVHLSLPLCSSVAPCAFTFGPFLFSSHCGLFVSNNTSHILLFVGGACSLDAHLLLTGFSMLNCVLFSECSLFVHFLLTCCSWLAHVLFALGRMPLEFHGFLNGEHRTTYAFVRLRAPRGRPPEQMLCCHIRRAFFGPPHLGAPAHPASVGFCVAGEHTNPLQTTP